MRLRCQCLTHYACIVHWVRNGLGNKGSLRNRGGIACPYGVSGCEYSRRHNGEQFLLTAEDINILVEYGAVNELEDPLTPEEADKLARWLVEEDTPREPDEPAEPFVLATCPRPCPGCGLRATHFHGHCTLLLPSPARLRSTQARSHSYFTHTHTHPYTSPRTLMHSLTSPFPHLLSLLDPPFSLPSHSDEQSGLSSLQAQLLH